MRLLCQQFAVLTKQSIITKDASLEQPYVQAWFERLSKRIEVSERAHTTPAQMRTSTRARSAHTPHTHRACWCDSHSIGVDEGLGVQESGETMLVLLDDLPRINPLDQEQGPAALSWLPMQLPRNILLVATSTQGPDTLRLTASQKERLRAADCVIRMAAAEGKDQGPRDHLSCRTLWQ